MGRSFASRVSHPRLTWVVLVLWLVLAGVSAPLAGRLTAEQENDVAAWLPSDAEPPPGWCRRRPSRCWPPCR